MPLPRKPIVLCNRLVRQLRKRGRPVDISLWEARTQAAARAEPQKARPTALAMCVGRWGTFFTNARSALRVEAVIRRQERQGQDRERQAEGEGEVLKRLLCHLP